MNISDVYEADLVAGKDPGGPNLGGTGKGGDNAGDEPTPEIKPPLPQEIPAPQTPQLEIAPFQAPPPADPGLPAPEA